MVFYSSTVTMMQGPINIRFKKMVSAWLRYRQGFVLRGSLIIIIYLIIIIIIIIIIYVT